jgi:prophage regulatory protein
MKSLDPASQTASTSTAPSQNSATRLLRPRAVCQRIGVSRSTLWRLEQRGEFPAHRRISANAIGWLEHEVDAWILSRAAR